MGNQTQIKDSFIADDEDSFVADEVDSFTPDTVTPKGELFSTDVHESRGAKAPQYPIIENQPIVADRIKEPLSLEQIQSPKIQKELSGLPQTSIKTPYDGAIDPKEIDKLYTDPIINPLLSGIFSTPQAFREGFDKIAKQYEPSTTDPRARVINVLSGLIKSGFAAATPAAPELAAVSQLLSTSEALGKEAGVDIAPVVSPFSAIMKPETETGQSLAEIGDLLYQGLIAAGMHGTARSIKTKLSKNVPLSVGERNAIRSKPELAPLLKNLDEGIKQPSEKSPIDIRQPFSPEPIPKGFELEKPTPDIEKLAEPVRQNLIKSGEDPAFVNKLSYTELQKLAEQKGVDIKAPIDEAPVSRGGNLDVRGKANEAQLQSRLFELRDKINGNPRYKGRVADITEAQLLSRQLNQEFTLEKSGKAKLTDFETGKPKEGGLFDEPKTWGSAISESVSRLKEKGISPDKPQSSLTMGLDPRLLADPAKVKYVLEPLIEKATADVRLMIEQGKIKAEDFSNEIRKMLNALINQHPDFKDLPPKAKSTLAKSINRQTNALRYVSQKEADAVKKVTEIIKESKPIREETEKLYHFERQKRAAKLAGVYEKQRGEQALYRALGTQKGQLPKASFESVRNRVTQEEVDLLHNAVIESKKLDVYEKLTAQNALDKLFTKEGAAIPTRGELELLEDVFGKEFVDSILSKRSLWQKIKDNAIDAANIPRTIMASMDMSMPFRQGVIQTASHPIRASRAFVDMHKAFFSEKAYQQIKEDLATRDNANYYKEFKLDILDPDKSTGRLTQREESFVSKLAERIPVIGRGVRMSGRAAYTYTNKIRADIFDAYKAELEKAGIKPETHPEHYQALAQWLNTSTGRGNYGSFTRYAPTASALMFSPRLLKSRFDAINPVKYAQMPKEVRVKAMADMIKFVSAGTALLTLAKAGGASVETDPRSSDFGKIRIGDTRIDVWGGFVQIARFLSQLWTGERKTAKGKIIKMDNSTPISGSRLQTIYRFGESKLNPHIGMITDFLRGENYVGEEFKLDKEAIEHLAPLYLQDAYDAIKEHDPAKGILFSVPAFYGAGTSTYKPRPAKQKKLVP